LFDPPNLIRRLKVSDQQQWLSYQLLVQQSRTSLVKLSSHFVRSPLLFQVNQFLIVPSVHPLAA
jgi:hypothetical protein